MKNYLHGFWLRMERLYLCIALPAIILSLFTNMFGWLPDHIRPYGISILLTIGITLILVVLYIKLTLPKLTTSNGLTFINKQALAAQVEHHLNTARHVQLVGTGLYILRTKAIINTITSRVGKGELSIDICLGNPFSPGVASRFIEESIDGEQKVFGREGVWENVEQLIKLVGKANLGKNLHNIQVLLFSEYPTLATLIFDEDIYVYFYSYRCLGNESPILHLKSNSPESIFFINHSKRIISDSTPASEVINCRKNARFFSDSWINAAVFLIPNIDDAFYEFGSNCLGWDIRREKMVDAELPTNIKKRPPGFIAKFGFHATVGHSIFLANSGQLAHVSAELQALASEFSRFNLSNFTVNERSNGKETLAIFCEDKSGTVEALNHELVARVYPNAISSSYLVDGLIKKPAPTQRRRQLLMAKRYGAPNILSQLDLHFTIAMRPDTEKECHELKETLLQHINDLHQPEMIITEIVLAVQGKDKFWRTQGRFPLHTRWERRPEATLRILKEIDRN